MGREVIRLIQEFIEEDYKWKTVKIMATRKLVKEDMVKLTGLGYIDIGKELSAKEIRELISDLCVEFDEYDFLPNTLVPDVESVRTSYKNRLMKVSEWIEGVKERIESAEFGRKALPECVNLSGDGYYDGELVYDTWECPNCGAEDEYERGYTSEPKYCPNCGQRLCWDVFEEQTEQMVEKFYKFIVKKHELYCRVTKDVPMAKLKSLLQADKIEEISYDEFLEGVEEDG